MTSLSVSVPTGPVNASVRLFARAARDLNASRLWVGQSMSIETHQVFAFLSGLGYLQPFGSGVVLTPLQHPYQAATAARSIAALSGHDYVLGIGPGAAGFQTALGSRYSAPLDSMREYLDAVRGLLHGEGAVFEPDGARVDLTPMPSPPVYLGVGVLGVPMARVAREHADVAITWLAPLNYIGRKLVPELRGGQDSGRTRLVATVHCIVEPPGERFDLPQMVSSVVGRHLGAPHYLRMLKNAGLPISDDPAVNAKTVVEERVFAIGSVEEVVDRIEEYFAAGADEVAVNVGATLLTHGLAAAFRDLRAIFNETARRREMAA